MLINENNKIFNIGSKIGDFKLISELGRGSYGVVYKVQSLINKNIYVVKKMDLKHMKEKQQKEAWKEAMILKKVSHPNIIKYFTSFLEEENLYIVMEYAEGGDLYSLIKQNKKEKVTFTEEELWKFSYEILQGIDYLHSNNIIHRDIKCLNLFLTKNKTVKIGDLGVSKIVSSINALHCTRVGTPLYLSPELIKQVPYDFKVDIWSVGCSLYHMACLEPPFSGDNLIALGNNIVKTKQKNLPNFCNKEFCELVDKLLSKKSDNRPSAKEACNFIPESTKKEYLSIYGNNKKVSSEIEPDKEINKNNEIDNLSVTKIERKALPSVRPLSCVFNKNNFNSGNEEVKENVKQDYKDNKDVKNNNIKEINLVSNMIIPENRNEMNKIFFEDPSELIKTTNDHNNLNNFLKPYKQIKPVKIPTPRSFLDDVPKMTNFNNFNTNIISNNQSNKNLLSNNQSNNNLQNSNQSNINLQNINQSNINLQNNQPSKNLQNKNQSTKKILSPNNQSNKNLSNNNQFYNDQISNRLNPINVNQVKYNNNAIETCDEYPTKIIIPINNKNDYLNLIQNVDNFMIQTLYGEEQNKFDHIEKFNQKNEKDNDKTRIIKNYDSNVYSKENDYLRGETFKARLLSPKVRTTNKFRPNTASNNRILFSGLKLNNESESNNIQEDCNNLCPNIKLNRPFTAITKNKNIKDKGDNNNVINININFYNVDMNQKYMKPTPDKNLIYINDNLIKKERNEKESKITSNLKRPQTGKFPTNNFKNNLNLNLHGNENKNSEAVFSKILNAIESLNNGRSKNRQLTIYDLK